LLLVHPVCDAVAGEHLRVAPASLLERGDDEIKDLRGANAWPASVERAEIDLSIGAILVAHRGGRRSEDRIARLVARIITDVGDVVSSQDVAGAEGTRLSAGAGVDDAVHPGAVDRVDAASQTARDHPAVCLLLRVAGPQS